MSAERAPATPPPSRAEPGETPRGSGRFLDLERSPLWRVLAPIRRPLGNLGWPILLKELRSDFRKNRFFFTHLVCLAAMAAGVLWTVAVMAEDPTAKPAQIGREIFNVFFGIQYLVVLVVFPAFSANSLSEERSSETFDLLITTDLRPAEIVWGKFLASSGYCLIYIVATLPLLSISLLFAGVSLTEILLAYLILVGLTVFLSMAGVYISSGFSSSLRATLVMYVVSFAILAWSWFQMGDLIKGETTVVEALLKKLGPAAAPAGAAGGDDRAWRWLVSGAGLAAFLTLLFSYLFLFTATRLRPRAADRTSKLRILTVFAFAGALAWGLAGQGGVRPAAELKEALLGVFLGLFLVGLVSTSEPADVPSRLRKRFSGWSGALYPLRVFAPGPFWGMVYTLVLAAGGTAALWMAWGGSDPAVRETLLTLPLYLWAFAALGFFLSSLDFTPAYTALTVMFIFIITLLLPVIFQIGGRGDGIFSFYYLSPITLWASLDPAERTQDGPRFVLLGMPIIEVARPLFGGLGAILTILAVRRCRRRGYPLLRFGEAAAARKALSGSAPAAPRRSPPARGGRALPPAAPDARPAPRSPSSSPPG